MKIQKTWNTKGLKRDLSRVIPAHAVKSSVEDLFSYQSDATHYFVRQIPDLVVLPETTEHVARVLQYAHSHKVPVTPRGAGSGLSGGCTPVAGGIVLDMKRMNSICAINRGNMTAQVEAGVVLANFQKAVEGRGLFYPPDPQSMTVCTMGGNVATRAGGPRGVKYGTTGHYVLGLETVLPDGQVISTGGSCVKQSVGYDLTHLLTGSEGTLGVITKINVRLLPLPAYHKTAIVVCESVDQAATIVAEIIASGVVPAMLEFVTQMAALVMNTMITPPMNADGQAYLLLDMDGEEAQVETDAKKLESLCRDLNAKDVRVVHDQKESDSIWKARSSLYPLALSMAKKMIAEDVTVPRDKLPKFVAAISEISAKIGIGIGIAGHAGDGNMHPSILFSQIDDQTEKLAQEAIAEIVKAGLDLGGTISGEHGIGLHKAQFTPWELGQVQVDLMKRVKQAFDPTGIMNPGKLWPGQ